MKFNCEHCGEVDYVVVDGYRYGERLLEGVAFEVRRDDDGKYHAQVEEVARDYFAQFNQRMYLDQIEADVATEEFAICPKCGDEVRLNNPTAPSAPVTVMTLQKFADIIGAGSFAGGFGTTAPFFEPEVGDHETVNEEETETETPSTEGGDSGGGGASGDLDEPEPVSEPEESNDEPEESENSDDSSEDSDDSDDSSDDSSDSSGDES